MLCFFQDNGRNTATGYQNLRWTWDTGIAIITESRDRETKSGNTKSALWKITVRKMRGFLENFASKLLTNKTISSGL